MELANDNLHREYTYSLLLHVAIYNSILNIVLLGLAGGESMELQTHEQMEAGMHMQS